MAHKFYYKTLLISGGGVIASIYMFFHGVIEQQALLLTVTYNLLILILSFLKIRNIKAVTVLTVTLISLALFDHKIAGFHNIKIYEHIKLSSISNPYSLWLNFDKIFLLLLAVYYLNHHRHKLSLPQTLIKTFLITIAAICTLMSIAIYANYVKFSPNIPTILPKWIMLNLLAVLVEEVFFRGFIQNYLQEFFKVHKKNKIIALFGANLIFAAMHYPGGLAYIGFCFIAGMFYGVAFMLTQRLVASIITHFITNLAHILLFTYPSLVIN